MTFTVVKKSYTVTTLGSWRTSEKMFERYVIKRSLGSDYPSCYIYYDELPSSLYRYLPFWTRLNLFWSYRLIRTINGPVPIELKNREAAEKIATAMTILES
jgi:hypothetical protein